MIVDFLVKNILDLICEVEDYLLFLVDFFNGIGYLLEYFVFVVLLFLMKDVFFIVNKFVSIR